MGLKELKIIFDKPVYHSGETVKGKLFVVLGTPQKYRGIRITIKGMAETSWSVTKKKTDNIQRRSGKNIIKCFGQEVYFSRRFYIAGVYTGETELSSGEHAYSFEYKLPQNLPSSFESEFGYIRYNVNAIFDFPWRFDQEIERAFKVVSYYDLNKDPRAKEPIIEEETKTFSCLCCTSSPLFVNVSLPVRGYVPGQSMPIKVDIENQSGVRVNTVKFLLQKVVTYRVNTPNTDTRTEIITIIEVIKPVEGNKTVSYGQVLDIPFLPPSNLNSCGIIDLKYELKFEACVDGWRRRNLIIVTPILIGTVSLANYQSLVAPRQQNNRIKKKLDSEGFSHYAAVYYTAAGGPSSIVRAEEYPKENKSETSHLIPKPHKTSREDPHRVGKPAPYRT